MLTLATWTLGVALSPGDKVAVIDAGIEGCEVDVRGDAECAGEATVKEQALILYDDKTNDVTVVQPNEDGSY